MSTGTSFRSVLRNILSERDLPFCEFVALALYHPRFGYYASSESPVGRGGDFITAPALSPVFSFAIGGLAVEFMSRCEGEVCSIVDIGCGDGRLIDAIAAAVENRGGGGSARFFGVDRALGRVAVRGDRVTFTDSIEDVPRDGAHLFFSSELYDAFPFARLVRRGGDLHELCVTERDGALDWSERVAPPEYVAYFAERTIELADGQFADVSLEWTAYHERLAERVERGLIVTLDYGFPQEKLFHPRIRRFGTAAAYAGHRVTRDLLANPGEQDLTAHINFTDLERAGERHGARTLFFDRMAKFLLAIGVTEHPLFRPVHEIAIADAGEGLAIIEAREAARRLVLPDGIGEDLRVLVQGKGVPFEGWSFQRALFGE